MSWVFVNFWNVKPPRTNLKPSPQKRKAPLLKPFWRRFWKRVNFAEIKAWKCWLTFFFEKLKKKFHETKKRQGLKSNLERSDGVLNFGLAILTKFRSQSRSFIQASVSTTSLQMRCKKWIAVAVQFKISKFSVSFRGISPVGSTFIFLRWLKLAHICIQVTRLH